MAEVKESEGELSTSSKELHKRSNLLSRDDENELNSSKELVDKIDESGNQTASNLLGDNLIAQTSNQGDLLSFAKELKAEKEFER